MPSPDPVDDELRRTSSEPLMPSPDPVGHRVEAERLLAVGRDQAAATGKKFDAGMYIARAQTEAMLAIHDELRRIGDMIYRNGGHRA